MRIFVSCFLVSAILAIGHPLLARADQNDPRLDQLFADLKTSLSTSAVEDIETKIWAYWTSFPDDESVENTMTKATQLMQAGRLQSAERILSRIIDRVPDFSEAWNKRATVRFMNAIMTGQPMILPKCCNSNLGILAPYRGWG